ncbi:Uncharacterized protein BP5553_01469 [Venustampulla echinocandica]|uniref:Aminoglycoside phosphotransferase domain-containing protein n=1 Tax=Venustampulla echinocandica TaxID=2656787 RepID=A0A370U132_9HELO|nr:Uncharacterized protein BP5553_01469 [Venustampulla echinocandica]RDL41490.1 Uncharacterized protein BP5553_01469 [Venustampulla echinocandica]
MARTLPLLRGNITLDRALNDDGNVPIELRYPRQKQEFWKYLSARKDEIEALVSFHLGVSRCRVDDESVWLSSRFNVCIPVHINTPSSARVVLVRIPLPYKVGEALCPGNVDEKLRCEVATYIRMQEMCPDIPIPFLFGFGFPDGQMFTTPENASFLSRLVWYARRTLRAFLRLPNPCRYVGRRRPDALKTGYMIISWVSQGTMLSKSWDTLCHDKARRSNLFHGLARIMLSLNRSHLPRIGSFTLDNQGFTTLTNRPLTLRLHRLENEGIPRSIGRTSTYSATDLYLLDLLGSHDNRICHQPNSIHSKADGEQQLAALTMMRATLQHFTRPGYRYGPFVFSLTNLHQSNIFVDDKWNITSLIDLEWACSLPIEMQCPPYWLSGRAVDSIEPGEHLETFRQIITEYFDAFEQEERDITGEEPLYQTPIMRKCWDTGSFWYFHAANSPKGLYRLFNEHIQPLFHPEHSEMPIFDEVVAPYWDVGAADMIERKIKEKEEYKDRLRELFEAPEVSLSMS